MCQVLCDCCLGLNVQDSAVFQKITRSKNRGVICLCIVFRGFLNFRKEYFVTSQKILVELSLVGNLEQKYFRNSSWIYVLIHFIKAVRGNFTASKMQKKIAKASNNWGSSWNLGNVGEQAISWFPKKLFYLISYKLNAVSAQMFIFFPFTTAS